MATYNYGIRQGLNSKGIDNSRIGYANGYVTVDGKNFLKADFNNKGTTYTNQQNFNSAWNSFNAGQPSNGPKPTTPNPMLQAANNVKSSPQPSFTPYTSPTEDTLKRISDIIGNNSGFQYKAPDPFTYDPQSDPAYQSQLAEAKRNIADQQVDTNAVLRTQGQGKSSYSELVQQQIADKTMQSLADTLVPQLMNQAYQRYTDSANRNLQVQQMNYGIQQDAIANLANLYGLQDKEYFQNPITEAQLTGNYLPNEAKQAISNLLSLKQQAETKGITAAQRNELSKQADQLRAKLQSLGIDPSFYGADRSYNQASQNNPAIRTLAGQQLDMQRQGLNWSAAQDIWNATGRLVSPQSDWSGLIRQSQNGKTPLTLPAQQQQWENNFRAKQQQWENNFQAEQFAYQKVRDAISDQQWRMKFDEDVRQFGLSYALSQLQENNQQAYREAQLALSQDDNARAWLAYEDSLNQTPQSKYNGMSANQVYDAVRSMFTKKDPDTEQSYIPNDSDTKKRIYEQVMASGLPDGQDVQVMTMMGLTPRDIENFDKQYGVSSGKPGK